MTPAELAAIHMPPILESIKHNAPKCSVGDLQWLVDERVRLLAEVERLQRCVRMVRDMADVAGEKAGAERDNLLRSLHSARAMTLREAADVIEHGPSSTDFEARHGRNRD